MCGCMTLGLCAHLAKELHSANVEPIGTKSTRLGTVCDLTSLKNNAEMLFGCTWNVNFPV